MTDDTESLNYMIAFLDGALATGSALRIHDEDNARAVRGWLEELRQLREIRQKRQDATATATRAGIGPRLTEAHMED